MRIRPLVSSVVVSALIAASTVGALAPAAAAPADSFVSDGWEWEVLTGEVDLFGEITPPALTAVGGLSVDTTAPTLRAPSFPGVFALLLSSQWTYSNIVVSQPVVGGAATITADYAGAGGSAEVTAIIDGGSLEYTIVLPSTLSSLIVLNYDPVGDGYTESEIIVNDTSGTVFDEVGGWFSGSTSHHSGAWAIDQLESDPNDGWAVFLEAVDAPSSAALESPLSSATTVDGLLRAFFVADGASGIITPADTWIARVSLAGGAGCAADDQTLRSLAQSLTTSSASAVSADALGCLSVPAASGVAGVPLNELLPIELDPALESTSWWTHRDDLGLATGDLPAGVTAALELVNGEPHLRLRGTPEDAGTSTIALALGGASTDDDVDLVDAVGGEVALEIAPALAATGASPVPATLTAGAALFIALGALVMVAGARSGRRTGPTT